MGVFRSEEILHLKLRLPGDIDATVQLMDNFGKLHHEALEFIDLTKDDVEAKKSFAPMIKRCEDIETKMNNFIKCSNDFNQRIYKYTSYQQFTYDIEADRQSRDWTMGTYFDIWENEIIDSEKKIVDLIDSYQKIKEDLVIELEKKCVYEKYFSITGEMGLLPHNNSDDNIVTSPVEQAQAPGSNASLLNLMGIIKATDDIKMNRMVLRASRGRAMATFFDFEYPDNISLDFTKGKGIQKKIFIIFYPAEGREVLYKKLLQICDLLFASRYNPPNSNERSTLIETLNNMIKEKMGYLCQAEGSIMNYLRDVSGNENKPGKLDWFHWYFKKEKLIYENWNRCWLRENFIDGEVWVIAKYKDLLISILNKGDEKGIGTQGTFIEWYNNKDIEKPTYIPTNEFLWPFQEIVNTYGIPRYQEINPTYFNIVTFPFLFGVMFGDIGHGWLIMMFSIYLIWFCDDIKKSVGSPFKPLVKVRYFFFLLSLCSVYCGFWYNDFLSIPLPFFGTCYTNNESQTEAFRKDANCVYPFGWDPKWYIANNDLAFFNSFKMKFSVIFGVFHMIFGILLKGLNDFHFSNWLAFIFEFIPQLVFMTWLFGYMVVMIFIKWSINWDNKLDKAPSLITLMINIFIKTGSVNDMPLWGKTTGSTNVVYEQERFHILVLVISLVLIPVMLFPKPWMEYVSYKRKKEQEENMNSNMNNRLNDSNRDAYIHLSQVKLNDNLVEKSFLDFFINQCIHTIEFVLSTVSNTASYLRLWALSLAHVELTKVFFEKTLHYNIIDGDYYFGWGFVQVFVGYFVLANWTFFVLILMDFMECFLHTLRLHWVEFQNKFYHADGYLFRPYSFKYLIEINED